MAKDLSGLGTKRCETSALLLRWEYRAHSHDPVDAAANGPRLALRGGHQGIVFEVAELVNGRYRPWRALLCRPALIFHCQSFSEVWSRESTSAAPDGLFATKISRFSSQHSQVRIRVDAARTQLEERRDADYIGRHWTY